MYNNFNFFFWFMLLYKHTGWLFYIVLFMGFNTEILFNWNWWSKDLWMRLKGDSRIKLKHMAEIDTLLSVWYGSRPNLLTQSSVPPLALWSDPCKFPWLMLMSNENHTYTTYRIHIKIFHKLQFPNVLWGCALAFHSTTDCT